MKDFFKFSGFLFLAALIGFAGGVVAVPFYNYFNKALPSITCEPVSVANTYIVFTTFIFAGFTVVLAILGVVFAMQFSSTKEQQLHHIKEELLAQIRENKSDIGIKFVDESLNHIDVRNHFEDKMDIKIIQILKEKYEIDGDIEIRSIKDSIGG